MGALKHFFIGFLKEPIKKNIVISKWVWLLLLDFNHHHCTRGGVVLKLKPKSSEWFFQVTTCLYHQIQQMKHSHTISVQEKKFQMTSLGP